MSGAKSVVQSAARIFTVLRTFSADRAELTKAELARPARCRISLPVRSERIALGAFVDALLPELMRVTGALGTAFGQTALGPWAG